MSEVEIHVPVHVHMQRIYASRAQCRQASSAQLTEHRSAAAVAMIESGIE